MLSPARATALVMLSAAALVPTPARAQITGVAPGPSGSDASPADGVVVLGLAGPDDGDLRDSIRELLARLHLGVVAESGTRAIVARVQIDLSSPTDALLVVTDGVTSEIRLRRSIPRDASPAIVREEVAHAVQSAVESALLAARDRAAQPPPAPPPPPVVPVVVAPPPQAPTKEQPSPASARPSPYGLELVTLAGAGPIADGSGPGSRIGLGAVALSHGFLSPSFALSLLYAVPFDTGTVELSSHTTIVSVRALPAIELVHTTWIAVDLGAGGGIDEVTVAPRSGTLPQSNLASQTTRTDAMLSAMATAHLGIVPGVVFLVSAGVDVDLDARQYVLSQGPSDTDVLAPWRVRPMVLGGFGFTALGDGHLASSGGR